MKKKYFFTVYFLIIFLLSGCGFEPTYSSKKFLFRVDKINYEYNKINSQIARSLKSISNQNAKNILDINLKSRKEKKIISKNKSGDPEIFELIIYVDIEVKEIQKNFISKQNYKNNENKFELNEYEIEIEKQLINEIIDNILIYLANV